MREILSRFQLAGTPVSCERYGSGHINETYRAQTDAGRAYILQKINRRVFRNVPALMENIRAVTGHLAAREKDPRHVLTLVPTLAGESYAVDGAGEYYRVYDFVEGSVCLDSPRTPEDFYQSGVAFGTFQNLLADFPAATLSETIPRFHDTPARCQALQKAAREDARGRRREVEAELAFAFARADEADALQAMLRAGELPLRVTHNDTKLNNVLLDAVTGKPLCVIDLDTVMPGLAANDFGDSIRFGASTGAEDERDLSRIELSLPLYETYAKGFLGACGERLTRAEIDTLPLGAKLMTYECGVRFLADYLAGDVYFHTAYPGHNLDRCRTQFRLVADMEAKWDAMREVIAQNA